MAKIAAKDVTTVLSKYMLVDGYSQIADLEKSHGSWFVDKRDGREYLDLFSMFASMPIGYNHPKVLEAKERVAVSAINKPTNSDFYCIQMAEFVETLFNIALPDNFKYGFFIEGGGAAVENALKAAFDWKVKKNFKNGSKDISGFQIIHFEKCFHGRTGYTLSLTNTADPRKTAYFPKFNWPRINTPFITFPLEEDNLEAVKKDEMRAISAIENVISRQGDDIAAIIIEPIQGEGGDNHFRTDFIKELRRICDENELLLIFDEVQSGIGLTGKWWAWQHHNVKPDLMAFGKKSQVCGFVSGDRIDEIEDNVFKESSRINSTWGGSLTDMVRSTIYMEIIQDEKLVEQAAVTGQHLLNKLYSLQENFPQLISNSRGKGLMCAFDLPKSELRNKLITKVLENGTIVAASGTHSIRFRPHLNVTKEEIDLGIESIGNSIKLLSG